jgi:hypothetical protein
MRQGGRRPKVPASLANIDLNRVRRALFRADGNVTRAAKALKVNSVDLRRLTQRHPTLIMDALEQAHRLVDCAEAKLREALAGENKDRALAAATYILSHSAAARERGWSRHSASPSLDGLSFAAAPITVIWAGGDMPSGYRPSAPNVPEARALFSSGDSAEDERFH